MQLIKNYSYTDLCEMLIGKKVQFKSDCEFFPNFNVTGKVISISPSQNHNELLIKILRNNKKYDIGSNMKNLSFNIK